MLIARIVRTATTSPVPAVAAGRASTTSSLPLLTNRRFALRQCG